MRLVLYLLQLCQISTVCFLLSIEVVLTAFSQKRLLQISAADGVSLHYWWMAVAFDLRYIGHVLCYIQQQ